MKKLIVILALVCLLAIPAATALNVVFPENIYMREKDPADWSVIPGAKGDFKVMGDYFIFEASGLDAGAIYVLVDYYEEWPYANFISLVRTDPLGNARTGGALPELIYHYYPPDAPGDYQDITGAKIWLVQAADYRHGMLSWSPEGWLFEMNLLLP